MDLLSHIVVNVSSTLTTIWFVAALCFMWTPTYGRTDIWLTDVSRKVTFPERLFPERSL